MGWVGKRGLDWFSWESGKIQTSLTKFMPFTQVCQMFDQVSVECGGFKIIL